MFVNTKWLSRFTIIHRCESNCRSKFQVVDCEHEAVEPICDDPFLHDCLSTGHAWFLNDESVGPNMYRSCLFPGAYTYMYIHFDCSRYQKYTLF